MIIHYSATSANNKNITKLWPYFRLCNISKTSNSSQLVRSRQKTHKKEHNSPLGMLPYYQIEHNHKWGNERLNAYQTNPQKTHYVFKLNDKKWGPTT